MPVFAPRAIRSDPSTNTVLMENRIIDQTMEPDVGFLVVDMILLAFIATDCDLTQAAINDQ